VIQIESWYAQILDHLQKIANSPNSTAVQHWTNDIKTFVNSIVDRATKVTLKRRPGALDKYLQRVIGITVEELEDLIPVIIIDPCTHPNSRVCIPQPGPPA
jgi:hypothetical protein